MQRQGERETVLGELGLSVFVCVRAQSNAAAVHHTWVGDGFRRLYLLSCSTHHCSFSSFSYGIILRVSHLFSTEHIPHALMLTHLNKCSVEKQVAGG